MNNLFLYIQIVKNVQEVTYNIPILQQNHTESIPILCYDLDNFSENYLIQFAQKTIEESPKTLIYFDAQPAVSFPNLLPLLTYLVDNPDNIYLVLKGENILLKKMISIFPYLNLTENAHEIPLIRKHFEEFF